MAKRLDTTSFYRRILSDGWAIAWQHKQLWIFGFFATLLGFGGAFEAFFGTLRQAADALPGAAAQGSLSAFVPGFASVRAMILFSPTPALALAIFILLALLLGAVFAWMTVVSVGALVSDTRKISRGGEPTFADGVKSGTESFWPLLVVNVAVKVVEFLALAVTAMNLHALLRDGSVWSGFAYVGSYIALAVITFIASMIAIFGSIIVVAKKDHPSHAVPAAWKIVREHWLVMLEMSVLLVVASLAIGIAGTLPVLLLSVPLIFLIAVASSMGATVAVSSLFGLTAALLIVGAACVGALVTTFSTAAWTLLWSELAERTPAAILHRWAHRLRSATRKKR
jgi:hypothetical protein